MLLDQASRLSNCRDSGASFEAAAPGTTASAGCAVTEKATPIGEAGKKEAATDFTHNQVITPAPTLLGRSTAAADLSHATCPECSAQHKAVRG
jgi:hypothetical protein